MRHRWLSLLLLLFTLATHAETVANIPAPTAYVDDYANVFHGLQQSQMEAICTELHDKTKAQVFVVTVNTTAGTSIEEFANQLFHNWKIGEKKTDRGTLILFAVNDHKYRIEVGYGLEGILNDAKVGDIGRSMVPALRAADYDAAATTSLRTIAQTIADDSHITLDALHQPQPAPATGFTPMTDQKDQSIPTWLLWCIWIGVFGLILGMIILAARRGWQSSSGSTFWTSGSSSDSSSSSSDSGSSFGGGDGGDSGGGGASGSW